MNYIKQKLNERLWAMSIQKKMAYAFSLVFIFLSVIQAFTYSFYLTKIVNSNANDYILQTIKQGSGKIDAYIDSLKIISNNIIADTTIRNILVNHSSAFHETPKPLTYSEEMSINDELSKLTLAYDSINSIQIYTANFTVNYNFVSEFEGYSDILNTKEGNKLKESSGTLLLISPHKEYIDKISGKKAYVFSAVRKIVDYQTGLELGYVFINVSEDAIRQIISDITPVGDGTVLVFDSDGYIISSMESDKIDQKLDSFYLDQIGRLGSEGYFFSTENHTGYIVVYHKSEKNQWGTLTRIPVSEAAGDLNELRFMNIVISLTGILISVIVSWGISRGLTQPIKRLVKSMKQVGDGNLSVRVTVESNDEIGHLGMVFNHMTDELQKLIQEYYHEQLSNKEAQLKAIRAQINPHFLYNTLDTIYWMLVLKNETAISELVISLSEIMRYSISKDNNQDSVPAGTDLGILEHYVNIQKVRFGEKLEWKMEVDPSVYNCMIPKMMLQPIVENAINHGMKPAGEHLCVQMTGTIHAGKVLFTVRDNGIGMSKEHIHDILNEKLNTQQTRGTGFGLAGVNRRIKILFGKEYGIQIESKIGQGTSVTMDIPQKNNQQEDEDHETISGG